MKIRIHLRRWVDGFEPEKTAFDPIGKAGSATSVSNGYFSSSLELPIHDEDRKD